MEPAHWITIGLFFAGQIISMVGVVISTRIDVSKVKSQVGDLKDDLLNMQAEIKQLGNILITLADFKGELNRIQDRQMAQGQRLDEFTKNSNDDRRSLWIELNRIKLAEERRRSGDPS